MFTGSVIPLLPFPRPSPFFQPNFCNILCPTLSSGKALRYTRRVHTQFSTDFHWYYMYYVHKYALALFPGSPTHVRQREETGHHTVTKRGETMPLDHTSQSELFLRSQRNTCTYMCWQACHNIRMYMLVEEGCTLGVQFLSQLLQAHFWHRPQQPQQRLCYSTLLYLFSIWWPHDCTMGVVSRGQVREGRGKEGKEGGGGCYLCTDEGGASG